MPELSDADRALLTSRNARIMRAQLASLLAIYRCHFDRLDTVAPSYVQSSVHELLASFDRWTHDEAFAVAAVNPSAL